MKQIRIKIGPDGIIESETLGMKGKECLGYLKRIEAMTNATATDSFFTEDYYKQEKELLTENVLQEDTVNG